MATDLRPGGLDILYTFPLADGTSGQVLVTDGAGTVTWQTINTIYSANGTLIANRALDLDGFDLNFTDGITSRIFLNATTGFVGINEVSPTAKFHVKAQGALSTDVVVRVRNSADTANFFVVNGDGTFNLGTASLTNGFSYISDGRVLMAKSGANFIEINATTGQNRIFAPNNGLSITATSAQFNVQSTNTHLRVYQDTVQLTTTLQVGSGTNAILIQNGTAPSVNRTDHAWTYVNDITAGNAALHTRTEAGDIVKLYKQVEAALANTPNSGDAGTDALITALKNIVINAGFGASA